MNRTFISLLTITLSLFACAFAPGADKFFPMGVWYEGGVGAVRQNVIPDDLNKAAAQYDRDFADIAAHGVNVVVVPNTPPEHHQALLDAANKHGLKLIIELDLDGGELGKAIRNNGAVDEAEIRRTFETKLGPIKSNPALFRVQLLDEPPAGSFQRYRKVADILKQYDPDMPGFCCLAGTGAVNEFAKIVQPDVIAWDNYPLGPGTPMDAAAALKNFTQAAQDSAEIGAAHHADVWGVIQCHDFPGGLRMPTPAEVRCMTWSSIAAGSRGVFWFLYQTEWFDPAGHSKMRGLVNEQYQSSDRWDEVGKLTREISALSPIFTDNLTPIPASRGSDFSTMLLKDGHGKVYAFVINFDTQHSQKVTAHAVGREGGSVVRVPSGETIHAEQAHGEFTWTTDLGPGDCAVFRLE